MAKMIDLTGQLFGRLTPIEKAQPRNGQSMWHCRCVCGKQTVVRAEHLRTGRSTSCGCYSRESHTKHGMSKTPVYRAWQHMKERCYNQSCEEFHNYGARGITVCDQWLNSFETFFADMGPKPSAAHSIDRTNNELGYSPDNCQWATDMEQIYNRRNTLTATLDGVTKPVKQWCKELRLVSYQVARARILRGVPPEIAITVQGHGLRGTVHHKQYSFSH